MVEGMNAIDRFLSDESFRTSCLNKAYECKTKHTGNTVYLRGLIELSNVCIKDCYYCGIRRGSSTLPRYTLSKGDVLAAVQQAIERRMGSIVIQAGEQQRPDYIDFVDDLLQSIRTLSNGRLGITLSLGEQREDTYRRWFQSGAHRYLLRIETSNRSLYESMHPATHSFDQRLEALHSLRRAGFQVGTGVLIGVPGQSTDDLMHDLDFFHEHDIDMIGMGPFVPNIDTPMGKSAVRPAHERVQLTMAMIALARIRLKTINMACTTALQTLAPNDGLERALRAGANVLMPNLTPLHARASYRLYDKSEFKHDFQSILQRIDAIGERIGFGLRGDAPHFKHRQSFQGDNS